MLTDDQNVDTDGDGFPPDENGTLYVGSCDQQILCFEMLGWIGLVGFNTGHVNASDMSGNGNLEWCMERPRILPVTDFGNFLLPSKYMVISGIEVASSETFIFE